MPTLFKRSNGIYYAILTDDHGRRRWISTRERNKSLALKKACTLQLDPVRSHERLTVSDFYDQFRQYGQTVYTKETLSVYDRAFARFNAQAGGLYMDAVKPRHIDLYKCARLAKVSPTTVNIELRALKAAFYTALRWELIEKNPFRQVKLCELTERTPVFLTVKDFQTLLRTVTDDWLHDMIVVAAMTGMRRAELINLRWSDVDFSRNVIRIESHGEFRTKRGRKRFIPMHEEVVRVLRRQPGESAGQYVFLVDGKPLSKHRVSMKFKRSIRKAGLDDAIHWHSLRHSFASWLVQRSVSLYEVQKLLGHTSIRVTEIYSHLLPDNLQDSIRKLPPTLG